MENEKETQRYWYKAIEATGSMKERVKVGQYFSVKQSYGTTYTWTIFDFTKGKETGTFTGIFVGKHTLSEIKELEKADKKLLPRNQKVG